MDWFLHDRDLRHERVEDSSSIGYNDLSEILTPIFFKTCVYLLFLLCIRKQQNNKDSFCKYERIRGYLWINSYLPRKSIKKRFFCTL